MHIFPLFIRVGRKQNLQKSEVLANYSNTGFKMNVCSSGVSMQSGTHGKVGNVRPFIII